MKFICKCGRKFEKNTKSATTGYRLDDYGPQHECYGCPFVLKLYDGYPDYKLRGYECRGSKSIRYDSMAQLGTGDKNVGKIYSLDLDFLHRVWHYADNREGIEPNRYAFSNRPSDYGFDGRFILTIYPTQNKAGILAKKMILQEFFNPDGSRKGLSPEQEKNLTLDAIRKAKEEAQRMNTYFAPCGHKFHRAAGGASDVTVEVTGTAYSIGCFSCEHGRTEQGKENQGPQVFCRCFQKAAMQDTARCEEKNGSMITQEESEEGKSMGKLNLFNISAGLNKVKSVAESLANVSHFELVPLESIEPAQHNPFSEQDDDQSRYEVAMSIEANGLIEPLAVNKKSDEKYTLISGEHRFTAIRQYLSGQFKNVPCMVFEGLSDEEAELKLYEANSHREYTAEQKFRRYQELEALLRRMKESGTYHGGIQKGLAERLGISTRQVRKYQTIMLLPAEKQQAVLHGEISINDASRTTPQAEAKMPESLGADQKSGPGSAFSKGSENFRESYSAAEHVEDSRQGQAPGKIENPEDAKPQGEEIDHDYWDSKICATIKQHYDTSALFKYYLFEVPTTQEAIRDKLKPQYGYSGGTVDFPDKQSGFRTARSSCFEIECGKHRIHLTYSQIDGYVREMIRHDELITKEGIEKLLSEKFHMNREG